MKWSVPAIALAVGLGAGLSVGGVAGAQPSGGVTLAVDCVFHAKTAADRKAGGQPVVIPAGAASSLWALKQPTYTEYLRFYADGTVIGVSSTGTPVQLRPWFKAPYANTGRYAVKGATLKFYLVSSDGRVDYTGLIEGEQLHLYSCSYINLARSTDYYQRVAGE
jgi:hypothetical protein